MIDGLFKKKIDPLWEKLAHPVAGLASANQVTLAGLLFVTGCCGAFHFHQSPLWFGLSLAVAFSADSLDGAVARLRNEQSHFGGYFDAIVDRYQELLVFVSLASFADAWAAAFLAFSGSVFTSYAKARTAIEVPVDNDTWPDFFERQERIIYLCLMLVAASILHSQHIPQQSVIKIGLWLLAGISHATVAQRFLRASAMLHRADEVKRASPSAAPLPGLEQQQQDHRP